MAHFVRDLLLHDGFEIMSGGSKNGKDILTVQGHRMYQEKLEPEHERVVWRCADTQRCPGRAWTDGGRVTYVRLRTDHRAECIPNAATAAVKNAFKQMRHVAAVQPHQKVKHVYDDFAHHLHGNAETAELVPTFAQKKSQLYRIRQAAFPPQPDTLADLVLPAEYQHTKAGAPFILYRSADNGIIIWGTDDNIRLLANATEYFCDGTFAHIPANYYKQMWTLHIVYRHKWMPVIFAMLPGKTVDIYVTVMRALKDRAMQLGCVLQPVTFRSDFETGLFPAIEAEFPNADTKGCLFHYCQCIYRKVQALGLTNYFRHDEEGQKDIRYLMAIPFLRPDHVQPWFDAWVAQLPLDRRNMIAELLQYYRRQWLEGVPLLRWNMYHVERRCNNGPESFHSGLKQTVGQDYRHLFKFFAVLQRVQANTELLKTQLDLGQNVVRPLHKTYRRINTTISNLTERYDQDGDGTAMINGVYRCLASPLNITL